MLRYDRQIKPGLVTLYDIRPGNGVGLFYSYSPGAHTRLIKISRHAIKNYYINAYSQQCLVSKQVVSKSV